MAYILRAARPDDLPLLMHIETQALALLEGHPVHAVFAGHATPAGDFAAGRQRDCLWVACEGGRDTPVGYVLAGDLDGDFHILQMDVSPAHGRRGVGRALLEHACARARTRGYRHAVLTTLSDVAWNAPFYARTGFQVLAPGQWTAGLRAVMQHERSLGFPMDLRVAMWRDLQAGSYEAAST
ncbi:GNAT family N-acetyltransferase [Bordetella petrii]|uniref:GNAT family N-acetyltransferase n=1 Tax=Bordetella petrii TaxID=94624 RepID=UPI001E2B6E4B|nr:GNAT family N-acetyltransferase [Bordetella petrii]MCD0505013.1 GNAT family N-acetyltransferase [Bordetella petrii]